MIQSDKSINKNGSYLLLSAVFCAAPFLTGVFREWQSALVSLLLAAVIAVRTAESRKLRLARTPLTYAAVLLPAAFAVSALWAADRGMALVGMIKFLPLPLFAAALTQYGPEKRDRLLDALPYCGAAMTAASLALCLVPSLRELVTVNGRLAGAFQYPNTFALYLLAGAAAALYGRKPSAMRASAALISAAGIVMSGSRAAILLMIAFLPAYVVSLKDKKTRLKAALIAAAGLAAAAAAVFIAGGDSVISRITTLSWRSSTVIGRLLYDVDALPVILKNPFGLGYLGYYFRQGGFQTGVYSVMHVHNDIFQLPLDVGWIPAALFGWAVVSSLKRADKRKRMLTAVILLHSAVDFDLQFVAVDLVLLTALTYDGEKSFDLSAKQTAAGCAAAGLLSLWLGSASLMYSLRAYDIAAGIYPGYTLAYLSKLGEDEGAAKNADAGRIAALNGSCAPAYRVLARSAFAEGDVTGMIKYAEKGISLSKYDLAGYLDYIDMLSIAADMFRRSGDAESEAFCRARLAGIPAALEEVKRSTSPLAWMITDRPELDLPPEYTEKINGNG